MSIILNTNEYGFIPFLHTNVDAFIIGLKDFCVNQKYCVTIKKLPEIIKKIKKEHKSLYLSINMFANEKHTIKFKNIINKLKNLDIDYFVVSDLGILNIFKENNLSDKVILDLQTYVTNKYSAKSLLDLGINRVCLSKEITLEDIKEIASFNNGNIDVLCQGYVPITYSKRSILSRYYSKYNLKKANGIHYIKEESRENYYYLDESNNDLIVYNDKQYSLFPYLNDLLNNNINHLRIDANFLNEQEIIEYIELYSKGIEYITNNELDKYNKLKEEFINSHSFDNRFLQNSSFLLKEGK